MKLARVLALTLSTLVVSAGLVGVTAPAHADTSWGCPGCKVAGPGGK